jgi:protein-disulfide isomerase
VDADEATWPYFAGHGIACVRVDSRGAGNSSGVLDDEYSAQQQRDACDAVEWAARQPWCTGSVGLMGCSWGGFIALQAAALMMRGIQEGADDVEVLDGAQQHIRNARRVHTFDLAEVPWKGAENPTVVIVEFADFQCPACREVSTVLGSLLPEFESNLRIYYRQFPLPSHPNATPAAIASLAAHEQGQFWPYHDRIFSNQSRLNSTDDPTPLLLQWADELGLDRDRFVADLASPRLRQRVEADIAAGSGAGLMGTPTLYLNGVMVMDAYNRDALRARIQSALPR